MISFYFCKSKKVIFDYKLQLLYLSLPPSSYNLFIVPIDAFNHSLMTISTDNNDEMRHGDTDKVREKGVNVKIEMDWCFYVVSKVKRNSDPA